MLTQILDEHEHGHGRKSEGADTARLGRSVNEAVTAITKWGAEPEERLDGLVIQHPMPGACIHVIYVVYGITYTP